MYKPLIIFFLVLTLVSCVSQKKYDKLQLENENLGKKIEILDQQNNSYVAQLESCDKENRQLKDRNSELENKNEGLDDFMVDPDPGHDGFETALDKKAEYIYGDNEMRNYIANNVKYPEEAKDKKIEGKVYVKFIVDEKGNASNFKIVKNAHPLLDEEALRVISNMKRWKPAESSGKAVKSEYVLPVVFSLK